MSPESALSSSPELGDKPADDAETGSLFPHSEAGTPVSPEPGDEADGDRSRRPAVDPIGLLKTLKARLEKVVVELRAENEDLRQRLRAAEERLQENVDELRSLRLERQEVCEEIEAVLSALGDRQD